MRLHMVPMLTLISRRNCLPSVPQQPYACLKKVWHSRRSELTGAIEVVDSLAPPPSRFKTWQATQSGGHHIHQTKPVFRNSGCSSRTEIGRTYGAPPRWAWAVAILGISPLCGRESHCHGRHAAWTTSPKQRQKQPNFVPSYSLPSLAKPSSNPHLFGGCSHFSGLWASINGPKQNNHARHPGSFKSAPRCLHRVPRPKTRAHQPFQVPFGDIGRRRPTS